MRKSYPSIIVLLMLSLAGCAADTKELDAALLALKETRVQVQGEIEKIKVEVAKSTLTPEQRATWEAKLQSASNFLVKVEKVEKKLDEQKDALASNDPGTAIVAGGKAIGAGIGGPYEGLVNIGALLIGGIVTGIYKGRQTAQVKGAAIEAIGTFSTALQSGLIVMTPEGKARLQAAQSQAAKSIVHEAQAAYSDAMTLAAPPKSPPTPS